MPQFTIFDFVFGTGIKTVQRIPLYMVPFFSFLISILTYYTWLMDINAYFYWKWDYLVFLQQSFDIGYVASYDLLLVMLQISGIIIIYGMIWDGSKGRDPFR